jgi:dTDP-4-amino-4,6-dideoxygalactose transaminase
MGDCSIYALHKVMPLEKGGLLRVNNPKFNYLCQSKISSVSAEELQALTYIDYGKIITKRIENYKKLACKLSLINQITLIYPCLPDNTIPLNLPILVDDSLREKLYFKLIELNVPVVALYYRMIKQIKITEFPMSYQLANNILNFPIHQEIDLVK